MIYVIISNSLVIVPFLAHKLTFDDFVSLVMNKPVQRFNDSIQVKTFWYVVSTVLTFGQMVVVIYALEDEAQALWHKLHLGHLTLMKEVECDLSKLVIRTHAVYCLTTELQSSIQ